MKCYRLWFSKVEYLRRTNNNVGLATFCFAPAFAGGRRPRPVPAIGINFALLAQEANQCLWQADMKYQELPAFFINNN